MESSRSKPTVKKLAAIFLFFIWVPFFTAFVIQMLWNWFVADVVHATTISYWQACGIAMLLHFILDRTSREGATEKQLKQLYLIYLMAEACVPSEVKETVMNAVTEAAGAWWEPVVLGSLGKVISGMWMLGVGFAIHTFLA